MSASRYNLLLFLGFLPKTGLSCNWPVDNYFLSITGLTLAIISAVRPVRNW